MDAGAIHRWFEVVEGGFAFEDEEQGLAGEGAQRLEREDGADGAPFAGLDLERATLEKGKRFACMFGEGAQRFDGGGVERCEQGKQFGADAIARALRVAVGGIVTRGEAKLGTDGGCLGTTEGKDGPEEEPCRGARHRGRREDAPHAPDAAAAQEVEEDGLGVVIGGVAGDDGVAGFFFGGEGEELVAHRAGGFFDAAVLARCDLANRALAGDNRKAEAGGVLSDEGEVGGGVVAELVVEVCNDEGEAEPFAEGKEKVKDGEGVLATGDGDEEAAAPVEEALGGGEAFDGPQGCVEGGVFSGGRGAATTGRRAAPAGRLVG